MSYNHKRCRTILVLMPDKHMGNVVVSLAAIKALKEFYKTSHFHVLVDAAYREILETLVARDSLILYPRKSLKGGLMQRLIHFSEFLLNLRRLSPDIAIDLQGRELSSTLAFLSGADLRIGSSSARRSFFYNKKVDIPRGRHRVYTYLEIASSVGAEKNTRTPSLRVDNNKKNTLKNYFRKAGISPKKPVVCIHAGAGKIYKQWNIDGFVTISYWLAEKGYQVVLIGSAAEAEMNKRIISQAPRNVFNTAGKLSFGELMALFEISSVYLGNDSGPMHLAAAAGTPVIALFGPAEENRWRPLSDKAIVLRGEEPCEKCTGKNCSYNFKCITTLKINDVKTTVEDMLAAEGKKTTE